MSHPSLTKDGRFRKEDRLKAGRGFERAGTGKWVLQYVSTDATRTRAGSAVGRDGRHSGMRQDAAGRELQRKTPERRSVSQMSLKPDMEAKVGQSRFVKDEHLYERSQQELAQRAKEKKLLKVLRKRIQTVFADTSNLPINLWKSFTRFDTDQSGRIEFEEFVNVCQYLGIHESDVGRDGLLVLFHSCADKNHDGKVDFQEFLRAVVGHIVSL